MHNLSAEIEAYTTCVHRTSNYGGAMQKIRRTFLMENHMNRFTSLDLGSPAEESC